MVVVFAVHSAFLHLFGIDVVEAHVAIGLVHGFITALFHLNEVFQTDVQVVDFRPNGIFVGGRCPPWGHLHRHFVFVVVFGEVGTDTHEDGEVLVLQRTVLMGGFGVDKHLEVFVLSQVEVGSFVDGATVAIGEVLHGHLQRLLVDAGGLHRSDHHFLLDARRDDVGHRLASAVFVDADGRNVESGRVADVVRLVFARSLNALRIGTPFTFDEVEGGKTQHDGALEFGDEHTHEADARHVIDVANDFVGLLHWDAELVPSGLRCLSVGQRDIVGTENVGHVVASHDHLGGVEVDDVLVITLRLTQGVVIVDVFHIGQSGVAGGVNLSLLLVGRGVAVGAVVFLVALKDAGV